MAWLCAIVEQHGLEVLLKALLLAVRRSELMQMMERVCNARSGEEPQLSGGMGEDSSLVQRRPSHRQSKAARPPSTILAAAS